MAMLKIHLFGRFSAEVDGRPLAGLDSCKLQELLAYVLLNRSAPHPREALAALLWGESSTAQSKKYLRQALWQIHSALAAGAGEPQILRAEPEWVQLSPGADVWLDVAVFERAFEAARGVPGRDLDADRTAALREAVALYAGDLLEGWYQDWCLCERERFQSAYLVALDKLMSYSEANGEYEAGIAYGQCVMRLERARECTHRRLMRLYYLAGDRTAALRQYDRCAAALDEELGVRPAGRTVALCERIRADALAGPEPAGGGDARQSEVFARLRRLRAALEAVRREIKKEIDAVDAALGGRR